jgi:hypothetical protein
MWLMGLEPTTFSLKADALPVELYAFIYIFTRTNITLPPNLLPDLLNCINHNQPAIGVVGPVIGDYGLGREVIVHILDNSALHFIY